jgi:hypothetical protein
MTLPENLQQKVFPDIRWQPLEDWNEAEAWLDLYNRELQQALEGRQSEGQGVCFTLVHGGELYLHTNGDGDILLDVTPEAAWVQPVLTAVTRQNAPAGQIWLVAGDRSDAFADGIEQPDRQYPFSAGTQLPRTRFALSDQDKFVSTPCCCIFLNPD